MYIYMNVKYREVRLYIGHDLVYTVYLTSAPRRGKKPHVTAERRSLHSPPPASEIKQKWPLTSNKSVSFLSNHFHDMSGIIPNHPVMSYYYAYKVNLF